MKVSDLVFRQEQKRLSILINKIDDLYQELRNSKLVPQADLAPTLQLIGKCMKYGIDASERLSDYLFEEEEEEDF